MDGAVVDIPVDDSGTVVEGTIVVGRGVVPVVALVVVGTMHAITPMVT